VEPIHKVALIETLELISTSIEVLITLLNTIYWNGGAYYQYLQHQTLPKVSAIGERGARSNNLHFSYSIVTSQPWNNIHSKHNVIEKNHLVLTSNFMV